MPIVKTYDITTPEEVLKIYKSSKKMQELNKYKEYTPEDIMLVRTTEIFPATGKLTAMNESSFLPKEKRNFLYSSFNFNYEKSELEKLETYEFYYRSTIHFTENGLVQSHAQGNFDNRQFIILEPLSEQLDKCDFRSFAGQDTFIKGPMQLSDKAIIIVKAENYESIKQMHPEIEQFNVVLYNGITEEDKQKYIKEHEDDGIPSFDVDDQRAVVQMALMNLGYTPELISNKYITNSPTSDKIVKLNEELAEKYNAVSNTNHAFTNEYKEDFDKRNMITDIFDRALLDFIVKLHNIKNIDDRPNRMTAYNLLEILGFDSLAASVEMFNKTIEQMKERGIILSGDQLLEAGNLNVYDAYLECNLEDSPKLS